MRLSCYISQPRGFNLLELLTTLIISSILLLLALPTFSYLWQHNKTITVVDQLITAINYARSSAVLQNTIVTLCGSGDHQHCDGQWQLGQIVMVDTNQKTLRVYPALASGDHLFWQSSMGKSEYLKMAATGFTYGQNGSFYYCPKYPNTQDGAIIVVSLSGRVRVDYDPQQLQQACL